MSKRNKIVLCVALCLCLISGIVASSLQSSFGAVEVEDFNVIVQDGNYVNGQLYIPKDASEENKLPLLIFLHGNFNNYDMQDQNAIELSRRGFVVMITDNFNMGNSSITEIGAWDMSEIRLMVEYACACYNFIDTDKIGIYGHSLGGYVAHDAVQYYLTEEANGGVCKVAAILDAGNDPAYTPFVNEATGEEIPLAVHWGVLAAKWDEWCYTGETGNPSLYLSSDAARSFIEQAEGVKLEGDVENWKIYKGNIGERECIRVIYQIPGFHAMNHFSRYGAAAAVDFFYNCFGVPSGHSYIDPFDQIWLWKEIFNFLGLIGIFLFLAPFGSMLIHGTTFFGELKAEKLPAVPRPNTKKKKSLYWIDYLLNCALPALLFLPVAWKLVGGSNWIPGTDWGPASTENHWFGLPNINEMAAWCAVSGAVLLILFVIFRALSKEKDEPLIPDYWGVKISLRKLWKSILLALAVVTAAYFILYFTQFVFNTDFRFWLVSMRVFTFRAVVYSFAYAPAYVLFYLVNSLLVNGGNAVEGRSEWKVLLLSIVANIIGILILLAIQYGTFTSTGSLPFNAMRILQLIAFVLLIPVGTLITRRFFKETGSIFAGSIAVGLLYALMAIATTTNLSTITFYWH